MKGRSEQHTYKAVLGPSAQDDEKEVPDQVGDDSGMEPDGSSVGWARMTAVGGVRGWPPRARG